MWKLFNKRKVKATIKKIDNYDTIEGILLDSHPILIVEQEAQSWQNSSFNPLEILAPKSHGYRDVMDHVTYCSYRDEVREDDYNTSVYSHRTMYHYSAVVSYQVDGQTFNATIDLNYQEHRAEIGERVTLTFLRDSPETVVKAERTIWDLLMKN